MVGWLENPILWMSLAGTFMILVMITIIFFIIAAKKTHAFVELKSMIKGKPIGIFFRDDKHVDFKVVTPDAGLIQDKMYGSFILNDQASYIDKRTHNILIPFDANFGSSVNIHSACLCDNLEYIIDNESDMIALCEAVRTNIYDENASIDILKTSVEIGTIKKLMPHILPHEVTSLIEQKIKIRSGNATGGMKPQIILSVLAILGAIGLGYAAIKLLL